MRNIIVESGHGLYTESPRISDPGAILRLPEGLYTERNFTRDFGLMVRDTLRPKPDLNVILAGVETEATKKKKTRYVNMVIKNPKDYIACSIHVNSDASGQGTGCEVFYKKNDPASRRLAEHVAEEYSKWTGLQLRKVVPTSLHPLGRLYIDDWKCPAVLIETGFIKRDLQKLKDTQRIGQGIAHSLYTYA